MTSNQQDSVAKDDVDASNVSLVNKTQIKIPRDYPNVDPYDTKPGEKPYRMEINWSNLLMFAYLHVACVIAIFMPITAAEALFVFVYGFMHMYGILAGAHRYWAHKSYKVTRPLYWRF